MSLFLFEPKSPPTGFVGGAILTVARSHVHGGSVVWSAGQ